MKHEIERKFFVREMPDLSGIEPSHYERYFLISPTGTEIRISKIDARYFYEKKSHISALERTREKKEILRAEFEKLKPSETEGIIRDRYALSTNPDIAIQIYHGKFEGLVRAEVEFDSVEAARAFIPLPWMGQEMTGLPIARDGELLTLSSEEFLQYLKLLYPRSISSALTNSA